MEPKRSKYDTNPLDEAVSEQASESFGSKHASSATEPVKGVHTQEIQASADTARAGAMASEAPTRLINEPTSYPSVFVSPKARARTYETPRRAVADIYQPPPVSPSNIYLPPTSPVIYPAGSRKIAGLGIPEKWAAMLPYLPFYLAMAIALVELLLVPRTETRTRFHASQALVLQIGITAVSMLLTFAGLLSGRFTGASLFNVATFVFLIIAMVRVWKGKPLVIPPLDEPRKWLDEKIKPRK